MKSAGTQTSHSAFQMVLAGTDVFTLTPGAARPDPVTTRKSRIMLAPLPGRRARRVAERLPQIGPFSPGDLPDSIPDTT